MSDIPEHLQHLQAFYAALYYVVFNFARAVLAFLQRDSYLYWPFILSTLVLMPLVALRTMGVAGAAQSRPWLRELRTYFSAALWWHPSARADYRLYFANALVLPLIFGWLLFGDAQIAGLLARAIDPLPGPQAAAVAQPAMAGLPARLLYTLVFFALYDLGRFIAHCLLHDIPVLWEFHKVHHSAEVLTPITAYRVHPVDLLIMAWVPALLTGSATWAFNRFAQSPVEFYTFLGLHVFLWAVNLVDNLRHSNVWLTYGARVGRWIVSPAHHQLHHSCEPGRIGCNRGFSLAVWDRLYGTLRVPQAQAEKFRMGLGDGRDARWHGVGRMYVLPFVGVARRLVVVRRLVVARGLGERLAKRASAAPPSADGSAPPQRRP